MKNIQILNLTILERDQRIVRNLQKLYDEMLAKDDPNYSEETKEELREFIRLELELWKESVRKELRKEELRKNLKRKSIENSFQPPKKSRT